MNIVQPNKTARTEMYCLWALSFITSFLRIDSPSFWLESLLPWLITGLCAASWGLFPPLITGLALNLPAFKEQSIYSLPTYKALSNRLWITHLTIFMYLS